MGRWTCIPGEKAGTGAELGEMGVQSERNLGSRPRHLVIVPSGLPIRSTPSIWQLPSALGTAANLQSSVCIRLLSTMIACQ